MSKHNFLLDILWLVYCVVADNIAGNDFMLTYIETSTSLCLSLSLSLRSFIKFPTISALLTAMQNRYTRLSTN
jgi:hypothetical protein